MQAVVEGENAAQYIVTTFHPQIVQIADMAYGVQHSNRISTIRTLPRKLALKFVRDDKSHGQRGGGAGAGAGKAVADGELPPGKRQKENEASETNTAGGADDVRSSG